MGRVLFSCGGSVMYIERSHCVPLPGGLVRLMGAIRSCGARASYVVRMKLHYCHRAVRIELGVDAS